MRSQDHALHYSASRGKNSAYVVTHHLVLFIYLTYLFSWPWPRPHSPGLGLKLLASFNITVSKPYLKYFFF